jgi:hypothetical protein
MNNQNHKDWYLSQYPQTAGESVQVGMPATFSVGTDSYGTEVAEVVRFKSGARAGLIKYITVKSQTINYGYGPEPIKFYAQPISSKCHDNYSETCLDCYQMELGVYRFVSNKTTGRVMVGYAKDYRDPHF